METMRISTNGGAVSSWEVVGLAMGTRSSAAGGPTCTKLLLARLDRRNTLQDMVTDIHHRASPHTMRLARSHLRFLCFLERAYDYRP